MFTTAAAHAEANHRGGTLRLTADSAFGSIDPQLNYALGFEQVFQVTNDGLVAFRKSGGAASNDVVADLADKLPAATDGGRTYVFHLRPGLIYSDGRPITTSDVVETFRRNFRVSSPAVTFFSDIVGADACMAHPAGCMLVGGVEGDEAGRTVTFHLTAPDAEFFYKLALPFGDVVPAATPDHDIGNDPVPATGPYMIARYQPNRHMTLLRNPHFHQWDDQAQPDGYVDRIEYDFGLSDEAEVTAVENNQYDWMYDDKPLDRLGELGSRFASRTHVTPVAYVYYLPMNTRLYPFDHAEAREAVNYALDRRALAIFKGGPGAALPLCQVLPEGFPAHVDYCPFTLGADVTHPATRWTAPDLDKARRLVARSGTRGAKVTLLVADHSFSKAMGDYIQSVLNQIGFVASVRALDFNVQFTYQQNSNNKVQISLTDWSEDFPAPSDFLRILYSCASFHPGSDASINISAFCDKDIDAMMAHAAAVAVTDPTAANVIWGQVDREITNRSLAANLVQLKWIDLVSTRLGNYTFSQISKLLFSRVWVQ
jgi:peptide/nickel transport system substrate-binding protein